MQHRYGPRTLAAMTTMAHLDAQVATILKTLDETGLAARTTVFVVSDHGFKAVKRQILPNAALAKAGLLRSDGGKITGADAYVVPEGGTAIVYVTVPDPRGEILARTRQALAGMEGIDAVIEEADYSRLGLPLPGANPQMGVLLLTAKDGYAFGGAIGERLVVDAVEGSLGSHGYIATEPDLRALFIASGRGIKAGVTLESVANLDIAPTAARLLGVELKNVDGKVMTEILGAR
jgi:predicted AlkP superfamily pyrophosphatase or phosphodiesterase